MMRHVLARSTLLALIAAVPAAVSAAPPPNPYQQRLLKLDPARRAAAIRSAIVDYGERCGRIEPPVARGRWKNAEMWAARCQPGGEYAVYIGPDGSAQVRPCADQVKLGLPACNLPPPTKTLPRRRS